MELEDGSTAYIALNGSVLDPISLESFTALTSDAKDVTKLSSQSSENTSAAGEEEENELSVRDRTKSFRCPHEGCGKLYTTLHHLKVMEKFKREHNG